MVASVREILECLCRLCARTDKFCVNVFSNEGDKHFIQKKIRLCLPVIVREQDEMPKQICLSCLNKLDSTYEFYTNCISAQSTIQRLLKAESPHDRGHVNNQGNETKEKSPASFSLDQFLKRKIDPVDREKSVKVQRTDKLEEDSRHDTACVESSETSDSGGNSSVSVAATSNSEFLCESTESEICNVSEAATNNPEFQCARTTGGNSNSFMVATSNSQLQSASSTGGNNKSSSVTSNNSEFHCATSSEPQKPKLRVKTTSELTQGGQVDSVKLRVKTTSELREPAQTGAVTDCVSALLSLQGSSAQSASVPTTSQSICVSASPSTNLIFAQSVMQHNSEITVSPLPQHIKSSSASKGGKSLSATVQNAKSESSVVQFGKNSSSVTQCIGSSPSVIQFVTTSSSAQQTATGSLSAPQNGTVSFPVPKNTAASLTAAAKNGTSSLALLQSLTNSLSAPQNVTNSSSVQQYSLSVPSSLSSGCTILPNVPQFIIVPNTFASTPTFTAAGASTVTVLAPTVPSDVSRVGLPTTLMTTQSVQPTLPASKEARTVLKEAQTVSKESRTVSTAAVPLASSSLPLVQMVPLQLAQQPPNPVMSSLTSAPTNVSQNSTAAKGTHSVLGSNSLAPLSISSSSPFPVITSIANVSSRADGRLSTRPQNMHVSTDTAVSCASNAPVKRASTEGRTVRLQSVNTGQGTSNAVSTVSSKRNSSPQLRTGVVPVSSTNSYTTILPKPTPLAAASTGIITSSSPFLLASLLTLSASNNKKHSLVQPGNSSDTESTPKRRMLLGHIARPYNFQTSDSDKGSQKTVSVATKGNCLRPDEMATAATTVSASEVTVPTPVPAVPSTSSGSPGPAPQLKLRGRPIVLKKTHSNISANCWISNISNETTINAQFQDMCAVSSVTTESQPSEVQPQQKMSVQRPRPPGGLPPPPPAVPLNTRNISECARRLANTDSANLWNGDVTSSSNQANKSELTPKSHGAVVTATVRPYTPTIWPVSEPQGQSPVDPSPEVQVESEGPSSQSPPAAGPGRASSSSPPPAAAAVRKEECPHCHIVFPVDILIHHKTLHYREKFYTCIDCDKNFVTEKGLESHRCQKESKG